MQLIFFSAKVSPVLIFKHQLIPKTGSSRSVLWCSDQFSTDTEQDSARLRLLQETFMTAPKAPSARKATCSDDMLYTQFCIGKTFKNTFSYYQVLSYFLHHVSSTSLLNLLQYLYISSIFFICSFTSCLGHIPRRGAIDAL